MGINFNAGLHMHIISTLGLMFNVGPHVQRWASCSTLGLMSGTPLFRPKPQNRVPLQPGQFGICRGELVEVRAVSGVSVTIIPYTLRDKEWRLSSDAYCVEISSKAINVVLDWSFTSSGGIVVSHQG